MSGDVHLLRDNQLRAVDPRESVWLSASAGTGKTQVLSARVLRLLLQADVDPSQILCLTFTKAGAAEMAVRINSVLARWVRLDDAKLATELDYIGAGVDDATRDRARTLFASVLDCPGGGLRIDTIHAFSQYLLASFPTEADLIPGARPMEEREREVLSREVLADMLVSAEREGDQTLIDAVAQFSCRKNPDALRSWLMRCANARELWFGLRGWKVPMRPQVLQLLGLPSDADSDWVVEALSPDIFPDHQLRAMAPTLAAWPAKTGQESLEFIEHWLALDVNQRPDAMDGFLKTLLKADGTPRVMKKPCDLDPQFALRQQEIADAIALVAERRSLLDLADFLAPALELGRKFATAWDAAKLREGLLDFDDLIQRAADLLSKKEMADWIRYKLDRQFNHVLVDEAQDTNSAQWRIIDALIDDFFSGEGAAGDKLRTIFTVGDYKQAIFGFQGTSPENFRKASERVKAAMCGAAQNALESRRRNAPNDLLELDLGQSFRTSQPVLSFVDQAIEAIGIGAFGLTEHHPHIGADRAGLVTLWNPVRTGGAAGDDADYAGEGEEGTEGWLARHDRLMADRIAEQVASWMKDQPFILEKGQRRPARPGDIMVLVRKRRELAALIVARLHARGVPVAGVDRLRLGAPLPVKDLMAALRFAAQPLDDLNLANLLASPLIGWSQDDLLAHLPRGPKIRLWHHLRESDVPLVSATVVKLRELLARADFETPQAMLQWMLVGPWQGRRQLVARLGREANDPIDELLNAGFAYEAVHTPSLAGFIHWFDTGEGELKRDAGEAPDQVRVMTVHGSKGLQAPIVILADATGNPGDAGALELEELVLGEDEPRMVPLPNLSKEERKGRVEEAQAARDAATLQEHWRLLYVAMTRAEEALFIGGSLSAREKEVHADSWYARLAPLFGADAEDDAIWRARRELGRKAASAADQTVSGVHERPPLPQWALTPIGPEPRPPRPLAPSGTGEDQGADPPLPPEQAQLAARRGTLIHRMLERLPELDTGAREVAATKWLARQAADLEEVDRAEMVEHALAVLADADFAAVFAPNALAEVPVAANVDGDVIAGTIDRLLVEADQITVVDFKTARRPPQNLEQVPQSTLRQMAAYVAALEVIYPGRKMRAGVLYTQTPQLIELPGDVLAAQKARFSTEQQSLAEPPIE